MCLSFLLFCFQDQNMLQMYNKFSDSQKNPLSEFLLSKFQKCVYLSPRPYIFKLLFCLDQLHSPLLFSILRLYIYIKFFCKFLTFSTLVSISNNERFYLFSLVEVLHQCSNLGVQFHGGEQYCGSFLKIARKRQHMLCLQQTSSWGSFLLLIMLS